jgi:hypothetical protein
MCSIMKFSVIASAIFAADAIRVKGDIRETEPAMCEADLLSIIPDFEERRMPRKALCQDDLLKMLENVEFNSDDYSSDEDNVMSSFAESTVRDTEPALCEEDLLKLVANWENMEFDSESDDLEVDPVDRLGHSAIEIEVGKLGEPVDENRLTFSEVEFAAGKKFKSKM